MLCAILKEDGSSVRKSLRAVYSGFDVCNYGESPVWQSLATEAVLEVLLPLINVKTVQNFAQTRYVEV